MKRCLSSRHAFLFLVMCTSFRLAVSNCLLSNGMTFKKHQSKILNAKPFETLLISYYLECLTHCEATPRCKSLNIKQQEKKLVCELFEENSETGTLIDNSSSTYYEQMSQFKAESSGNWVKNYCEPECRYAGACTKAVVKCKCDNGSIQPLQNDSTVMVGSKGNSYAKVTVNLPTGLYKIKLVHSFGSISCVRDYANFLVNFGCLTPLAETIEMMVTSSSNSVLLPGPNGCAHDGKKTRSKFITYKDAIHLTHGQQLRIWYREDLYKYNELDNFGSVFMYVLAIKQI